MTKDQVRARIEEVGIIPAIRVSSKEDAVFACEAIAHGGIPIVELTMTVPGAEELLKAMGRSGAGVIAGAGTVLDQETARRCLDAGAEFLTSPGLDIELVEFAAQRHVLVLPGALTPTEVLTAWKAGGDMVKVYPCSQVGGPKYIKALKGPFPQIPLIASGGVNHHTAQEFILAGAVALGIGGNLIPKEAIQLRQPERIRELARRFLGMVAEARRLMRGRNDGARYNNPMEREVAERFERVETTVLDLARAMVQHVEASDARMTRIETNLLRLSDSLGSFARSMNEFVEASNARMTRIEENVERLEQDLSALIRAIAAERGNGHPKG